MAQGVVPTLQSDRFLARTRVLRSLVALSGLHPMAHRRFRSLNYSGFFLCLSGLITVGFTVRVGASDVADVIALRFMAYACWLYGGLGLLTLLKPGAFEGTALAPLRGVELPNALPHAATLSLLLARGISLCSLPVLALALVLSGDEATVRARVDQLGLTLLYILACSLSLAVVGALCLALSARRARALALLFLIVPFALQLASLPVPNVIGGLIWGFGELVSAGAP